ncbi:MAG: hypothetical protein ACYTDT_01255, partial [Planctomycetota bacterium]
MKTWLTWVFFTLGVLAVAGVMAWSSDRMLVLEAEQQSNVRQKLKDENVRLALWKMDAEISPSIADEISRPYFHYTAFYPAEGAYTHMFKPLGKGEVLMPSPLLTATNSHVQLYFQYEPDGSLTSPQVPTGNMRDLAESWYSKGEDIETARGELEALSNTVTLELLRSEVSAVESDPLKLDIPEMVYADSTWAAQTAQNKM